MNQPEEIDKLKREYDLLRKLIENPAEYHRKKQRKTDFLVVSEYSTSSFVANLVAIETRHSVGEIYLLFLVKTKYIKVFKHWLKTSYPEPKLIENENTDLDEMYLVAAYYSSDIDENLHYKNPALATMISGCDRVNVVVRSCNEKDENAPQKLY